MKTSEILSQVRNVMNISFHLILNTNGAKDVLWELLGYKTFYGAQITFTRVATLRKMSTGWESPQQRSGHCTWLKGSRLIGDVGVVSLSGVQFKDIKWANGKPKKGIVYGFALQIIRPEKKESYVRMMVCACSPSYMEAEAEGSLELGSSRPAWTI